MTKQELASYLSSLISIMESKEDAGIERGQTLGREYTRAYGQMMDIIRKEEKDAAEQTERERQSRQKDRTGISGSEPRGSESPRVPRFETSGATLQGSGVRSPNGRREDPSVR